MRTEAILRALGDTTRLRIMRLLGTMELAVGELSQVLQQSQPRVSRHASILCDAGLAVRRREGSWIYLRAATEAAQGSPLTAAVARLLSIAEQEDAEFAAQCEEDRVQLAAIRNAREDKAAEWFEAHATEWDDLRRRHSPDEKVEAALNRALGGEPLGELLDIGVKAGLVEKSGAWFSYDSVRIGQGRENAKTYLKEHPELADRLEKAIRGKTEEVAEGMMTGPDAEDDGE